MKNIKIPKKAEEYRADVYARAFPDGRIPADGFYKNLIDWILDHRTPILYEQTDPSEYTNFSINFNWLLLRDYKDTKLGPQPLILSMYCLHEFSHMTHWLPTNLRDMTPGEYAEFFTQSEYIASNETEILIHYRIPGLRKELFPGTKIFYDTLIEAMTPMPTVSNLYDMRSILVEGHVLDSVLFPDADDKPILERFKYYSGNRPWARSRFTRIQPFFGDTPQSFGLTKAEYEEVITNYISSFNQQRYEANMIRNIKLGYVMCGKEAPSIESFDEAVEYAEKLSGSVAIV
jgi:hypothetical protein